MKKKNAPSCGFSNESIQYFRNPIGTERYRNNRAISEINDVKSTTYRFLQTMKTLGYVYQEDDSDKYGLSLKLFELSARSLEYVDLISFADKEMRKFLTKPVKLFTWEF